MATSLESDPTTNAPVLDAVAELAPVIAARAAETEAARRVPPDLVADLAAAGCFRMLLPASHGGHGVDLPTAIQVLEELSRADGSVGWTVALGASAWRDLSGLSRESFDAVFTGDEVIVAGAISPAGTAVPADGGYRVTGRWGFVSGCEHANWMFANTIETAPGGNGDGGGGGAPAGADAGGLPPLRIAVFSPGDIEIQDTWAVSGLRGTGSHHIVADDLFVPAERTYSLLTAESCVDVPFARIPLPSPYALELASVAIGIAQGALDDVLGLATTKVPLFAGSPLAANPLFQNQLGEADARLRAARAVVAEDARTMWALAEAGGPFTPEFRAHARASATWAAATAASIVDMAYTAGGGTSLYDSSPLQRRLRDTHAVTQHFLVRLDTLTTVGAVLVGQDVDITFL
jgi:alkylation response protein AidB-like acyl-CoA dehydrogenase